MKFAENIMDHLATFCAAFFAFRIGLFPWVLDTSPWLFLGLALLSLAIKGAITIAREDRAEQAQRKGEASR